MQVETIFVGVFLIISAYGAPNRNKDFIPQAYHTSYKDQVEQNVKVNPSSSYAVQPAEKQANILVNQQSKVPIQTVFYKQPINQKQVLVNNQENQQHLLMHQNPNQQTILLANLQPQQILTAQPNQPTNGNQPGNQPSAQLVYIQQPNDQQPIWVSSQPNQQSNQFMVNQSASKKPDQPVIFVSSQPNQQPIMLQQLPVKEVAFRDPTTNQPSQQYFLISPNPNQQTGQQGKNNISYQVVDQSTQQPTIWIASNQMQPTLFVNQQANQQPTNHLNTQTFVKVDQPNIVSSGNEPVFAKLNNGNIVILPIKESADPKTGGSNSYFIPVEQLSMRGNK